LRFEPVFDYEQVLVVAKNHPFSRRKYVVPSELESETLITYPVEIERLDVYSQFLAFITLARANRGAAASGGLRSR
jgi:LysR family transcriptional regulator, regulator for metE and metH